VGVEVRSIGELAYSVSSLIATTVR